MEKNCRAGRHVLGVLRICLQWLEAFEYSVGAIAGWWDPSKDVDILYCQSGHYLENKTETLRNSFRYRHRPRSHVPGELQRFIHCYDAVWQLLNPKLQRRNGG